MSFQKIILLFLIACVNFSFAQKIRKKKIDTVYVYEKVVVYDTVYLMKPLKFRLNDVVMKTPIVQETKFVTDAYKQEIYKQRASRRARLRKPVTFQYGIEGGFGIKSANWSLENKPQFGENLGIWASKSFFYSQFLVWVSANAYHWNSSFDLDANKESTFLNGYYFTEDNQALLFQRFNNEHFEFALQCKLMYNWKNFRPFAGILLNNQTYKMQFMTPENDVLTKLEDFQSTQTNLGFSLGLQYRFLRRFIISAEYQHYSIKNISLKNPDFDFEIFKTNNTFAERKINVGISYIISRL